MPFEVTLGQIISGLFAPIAWTFSPVYSLHTRTKAYLSNWSQQEAFLLLLLILMAIGFGLLADYDGDEGFYIYAGYLTARGQQPYRDFAFNNSPGSLLAYAPFFRLFGASLVVSRLVSVVFFIVALVVARKLVGHVSDNPRISFGCFLLLLIAAPADLPFLLRMGSRGSVVLLVLLLSVYFFVKRVSLLNFFLSGFFAGIAVGMKLTNLVLPMTLFSVIPLLILWKIETRTTLLKSSVGMVLGSILGVIVSMYPYLFYLDQAIHNTYIAQNILLQAHSFVLKRYVFPLVNWVIVHPFALVLLAIMISVHFYEMVTTRLGCTRGYIVDKRSWRHVALWMVFIAYCLSHILFPRPRYPYIALLSVYLSLLAALGIPQLLELVRNGDMKRSQILLPVSLAALFITGMSAYLGVNHRDGFLYSIHSLTRQVLKTEIAENEAGSKAHQIWQESGKPILFLSSGQFLLSQADFDKIFQGMSMGLDHFYYPELDEMLTVHDALRYHYLTPNSLRWLINHNEGLGGLIWGGDADGVRKTLGPYWYNQLVTQFPKITTPLETAVGSYVAFERED